MRRLYIHLTETFGGERIEISNTINLTRFDKFNPDVKDEEILRVFKRMEKELEQKLRLNNINAI